MSGGRIAAIGLSALAASLAGCSSGESLVVHQSGAVNLVRGTNVSCVASGDSVTVSGNLTAIGEPVEESSTVSAQVGNPSGHVIGSSTGPELTIERGSTMSFSFQVPITGSPYSCSVSWGALNPSV